MLNNYLTRKEQFILLFVAAAVVIGAIVMLMNRDRETPQAAEAAPVPTHPETSASLPLQPAQQLQQPPAPAVLAESPVTEPPSPPPPAESTTLRVAVRGAVYSPALYTFQSGEDPRVQDLLDAAGGLEEYADMSDINLAARLIDGTTLTVPGQPREDTSKAVITSVRLQSPPPPANPPQYTLSGWRPEAATRSAATNPAAGSTGGLAPAPTDGLLDLNSATQAELEALPGIGEVLASRIIEYRQQTPFRSVDELMNVKGIAEKRLADVRHLVTAR